MKKIRSAVVVGLHAIGIDAFHLDPALGGRGVSDAQHAADAARTEALMKAHGATMGHFGCGPRFLGAGWANFDRIRQPVPEGILYIRTELAQRLPLASDVLEYAFTEDFLEHLSQADSLIFLFELCRVMRPGGVARISCPGLPGVLRKHYTKPGYQGASVGKYDAYTQWRHVHFYCHESMTLAATQAGFSKVEFVPYGESAHPPLAGLDYRDTQREMNIYAELTK